jgi:hypothetical protein
MRKMQPILIAIMVLTISVPLMAQEEKPTMMVAKNHFINVSPGQALDFEAAYTGHIQWHADMNDTWYWHTWQIVNGKNLGDYIMRTGNHQWSDWDEHAEFSKADGAHFWKNVAPFVQDISSVMAISNDEISTWTNDYGMPTMVDVTVFHLKGEYHRAFYSAVKKLHEAIVDKEIPFTYAWSSVVSGGDGPAMTLVFPYKSWAEMGAVMDVPFWKMVEEAYGDFETDMLRKMISKSVKSQENFIAAYREDMSYNPPE